VPQGLGRPLPVLFPDGVGEDVCIAVPAEFRPNFSGEPGEGGDRARACGENPVSTGFSAIRGLTPSDGRAPEDSIPVSTTSQSTFPAHSDGSPSITRDQYRSPQIGPVLPARRLKRIENVCFNYCMIAGRCTPSAGLI
jgi:hypothetical protein